MIFLQNKNLRNNMLVLITIEVKNEGIPKLFSQYILKKIEWEPLKKYLKSDIDLVIIDEELSTDRIFITKNTIKIMEDYNEKHIDAFKILYKNSFYNYDLLTFIKKGLEKKSNHNVIFEMDDDDSDVGYYLKTKKNTPEFFDLDDEKIKKLVIETKKTVNLFKNTPND